MGVSSEPLGGHRWGFMLEVAHFNVKASRITVDDAPPSNGLESSVLKGSQLALVEGECDFSLEGAP
jgi:hypothetical protein